MGKSSSQLIFLHTMAVSVLNGVQVVQELALAPRGTFRCGQISINALKVLRAAAWLSYKLLSPPRGVVNAALLWRYVDPQMSSAMLLASSHSGSSTTGQLSSTVIEEEKSSVHGVNIVKSTSTLQHSRTRVGLTPLLVDFRHFSASRAHDKVYALLGLAQGFRENDRVSKWLEPDYEKSFVEVCQGAVRAAIYTSRSLRIIGALPRFFAPKDGPTWVPAFQDTEWDTYPRGLAGHFRASGDTMVDLEQLVGPPDGTLRLKGRICGSVARVSRWVQEHDMNEFIEVFKFLQAHVLDTIDQQDADVSSASAGENYNLLKFSSRIAKILSEKTLGLILCAGTTYNQLDATREGSEMHKRHWADFLKVLDTISETPRSNMPALRKALRAFSGSTGSASNFLSAMRTACTERCLFITVGRGGEQRFVGLGPAAIAPGDVVVILEGGPWPFALRPVGGHEPPVHHLVGPLYVPGSMHGEKAHLDSAPQTSQLFDIV